MTSFMFHHFNPLTYFYFVRLFLQKGKRASAHTHVFDEIIEVNTSGFFFHNFTVPSVVPTVVHLYKVRGGALTTNQILHIFARLWIKLLIMIMTVRHLNFVSTLFFFHNFTVPSVVPTCCPFVQGASRCFEDKSNFTHLFALCL